jgi:hypothetical protein
LESYEEYRWNDYENQFDWMHSGPSHGWQIAEGTFTGAEGTYPNYSDPVWENVLNETS